MTRKTRKRLMLQLEDCHWRGLEFEAGLLTTLFGKRITPEGVVLALIERTLQARQRRCPRS